MAKRNREYNHINQCDECGKSFSASRFDARYCSSKCRVAAKRAADRVRCAADVFLLRLVDALDQYIADSGADCANRSVNAYVPLLSAIRIIEFRSGHPLQSSGLFWWLCTQCGTKIHVAGLPDKLTHTNCACGLNAWKRIDTSSL